MNKIGKLIIQKEHIKEVNDIFKSLEFVCISSIYYPETYSIEYTGKCPRFDNVLSDEEIPTYAVYRDLSGNFLKTNGYCIMKI